MRITKEAPIAEPQTVERAAGEAVAGGDASNGRRAGVAVAIHGVTHSFGELRVIEGIHLEVSPGEVLGIVGPSGCGKSTLLELVSGLRKPTGGAIAVGDAQRPDARLERCAYMPQRDLLLPWPSA